MRKSILLALAGLMLFAGCKDQGKKMVIAPKWKGAPYRLAFDTKTAKPGTLIPAIQYTANPEMLERRAVLVVRFDSSQVKKQPVMDQIIMPPINISGEAGSLPADSIDSANKELANLLGAYCMKGKIKVTVALANSSLNSHAGDAEIQQKQLSDWTPIEVEFKKAHPGC